jgi:hypothetical protein
VNASNPFFAYIQAMAADGLTSGCGGGAFCPNKIAITCPDGGFCPEDPVSRGATAAFLANALSYLSTLDGGPAHCYQEPTTYCDHADAGFSDVSCP